MGEEDRDKADAGVSADGVYAESSVICLLARNRAKQLEYLGNRVSL